MTYNMEIDDLARLGEVGEEKELQSSDVFSSQEPYPLEAESFTDSASVLEEIADRDFMPTGNYCSNPECDSCQDEIKAEREQFIADISTEAIEVADALIKDAEIGEVVWDFGKSDQEAK